MRLSSLFIVLATFALASVASVLAARTAVAVVEDRSVIAVRSQLDLNGYEWANVQGDGLQVILEGEAPDEASRIRAVSSAGQIVDAARIINGMDVTATTQIAAPRFSIEMLRNDSGVSLIGLVPAAVDRDAISERITVLADGSAVTDLLETADYPVPDGWSEALSFGLRALGELPRSKISVDAERVAITATSDSPEQKRTFENSLSRRRPGNVRVELNISAPRPVITPFTLRYTIDETGGHFDSCSADTQETADRILAAARSAGLNADANCTLGLGAPSKTWAEAAEMSIASISELGGGSITFSDADITLIAPEGTAQGLFDRVVGELENELPPVFAVFAVLPEVPDADDQGPPEFTAIRSPEGLVQLRGRVKDDLMNTAAENYAKARLRISDVTMGTRLDGDLPANWSVRVFAGIEALAELSNGAVVVQPDVVTVRGNTGNQGATAKISQLLSEKLGEAEDFRIDVKYVEQLDPIAALPSPEECIEQIQAATSNVKITFEPGSANIDAGARSTVDQIAEILQRCTSTKIEIAGYTDSQGREVMNQQLSQQRAEAVLTALRARRVPTSAFTAIGYGEESPIADNETEDGREANRRIEFKLIQPAPTEETTTALEELENASEAEESDTTSDEQN
jgi:OmpA-OmpF porin, OOP family